MTGYISVELRQRIRLENADFCAYCQTPEHLTVVTFEVEHIVPRSAGGQTVFDNLCLACPTCNRCKADRQFVVDPVSETRVSIFHPQHDIWNEHFAWNDDATEIIGLTPTGRATIVALRMNRLQMIRVRRMWVALGEHPPNQDEPA